MNKIAYLGSELREMKKERIDVALRAILGAKTSKDFKIFMHEEITLGLQIAFTEALREKVLENITN